jgi:hypothetical protein
MLSKLKPFHDDGSFSAVGTGSFVVLFAISNTGAFTEFFTAALSLPQENIKTDGTTVKNRKPEKILFIFINLSHTGKKDNYLNFAKFFILALAKNLKVGL